LLAGCGDDDTTAPFRNVTGHYQPSAWTVTTGSTTSNVLAAGGELPLFLDPSGLTIGRLVAPASVGNGQAVNLGFDGRYTYTGGVIRIDSNQDVFLRDMPLAVQGTTLTGDRTFGTTRVQITFTRIPTP
jgi:hypothetical protein